MRLSLRIERLEARPAPPPSPALDVSRLSRAELRLLASLPIGDDRSRGFAGIEATATAGREARGQRHNWRVQAD
jgi:hypothetical protein